MLAKLDLKSILILRLLLALLSAGLLDPKGCPLGAFPSVGRSFYMGNSHAWSPGRGSCGLCLSSLPVSGISASHHAACLPLLSVVHCPVTFRSRLTLSLSQIIWSWRSHWSCPADKTSTGFLPNF